MATTTTRTRNLRLFLSSGLTTEAKANLEIIDRLGDTTYIDASETITFRSKTDIVLQPGDENVNGTKNNGRFYLGTANNKVLTMEFWPVSEAVFKAPIVVNDKLAITTANTTKQTLTINTGSIDRTLSLNGNLTVGQEISLTSSAAVTATFLPGTQTLVNTDSVQTLSNKVLNASCSVDLTGKIINADIATNAGIQYSKLNLTNSIKATDFATSSGKLTYSQVDLTGQLKNADWSSDVNDKLAGTKVNTDFASQELITSGFVSVRNNSTGNRAQIRAAATLSQTYEFILPEKAGLPGQVLAMLQPSQTNQVPLGWIDTGATVLPTDYILVGDAGTPKPTNTASLGDVLASVTAGLTIKTIPGLVAGNYGSTTTVPTVTITANGRVALANQVSIAIPSTQVTDFVEAVQDLIGGSLITSSTDIESTYIDEPTASLTFTLKKQAITGKVEVQPANEDYLLVADSSDSSNLKKVTVQAITELSGAAFSEDWLSGTNKQIMHNLNSRDLIIQIYSKDDYEDVLVDSVKRTTLSSIDLVSNQGPTGSGWRVLIKRI